MRTHALLHSCLVLASTYTAYGLALPVTQNANDPAVLHDASNGTVYLNGTVPTNSTDVLLAVKAAKPKPKAPAAKTTPKTVPKTTPKVQPTIKTTPKTIPAAKTTAKTTLPIAKTTAKTTAPAIAPTSVPAAVPPPVQTSKPLAIPTSLLTSLLPVATSLLGGGSGTGTGGGVGVGGGAGSVPVGTSASGPVETLNPFIPVTELANTATTPEDGSLDGPDNLRLRLIVPAPPTPQMPALVNKTIMLNGREWYITELFRTTANAATFPNYTAISYRWYDGRLPNPFFDGFLMSNLTLPSLASAMRNSQQNAFWIDCFSIPATKPLKGIVLDLLSNIFSAAHEVIVPLGLKDRTSMTTLATGNLATLPATTLQNMMADFNQEEWVNSIWTYKESLSAKTYTFTDRDITSYNATSTVPEPSLTEASFFKQISTLSQTYMQTTGLNDFDMRLQMRNVDALVELGLDRTLNAAYERSVFTSMASLDRRFVESEGNFFWGLYGAVTEDLMPADKPHSTLAEMYDRFFEVCEAKNDYSFIYTNTARRTLAGRTFYPESANLDSILNWPTSPDYQTATVNPDGKLTLDGMVSLAQQGTLGTVGKDFINQWFATNVPNITTDGTDASLASKAYEIIKLLDYQGSNQAILTTDGIFFPQQQVPVANTSVVVASQLGWSFGAPGLAQFNLANGTNYIPGAFVGSVVKTKAKSIVMT